MKDMITWPIAFTMVSVFLGALYTFVQIRKDTKKSDNGLSSKDLKEIYEFLQQIKDISKENSDDIDKLKENISKINGNVGILIEQIRTLIQGLM